jgi:hypothetical protein
MAEIAGSKREGLLALAAGTGLQVMLASMEADVTTLAGPRAATPPAAPRSRTATSAGR